MSLGLLLSWIALEINLSSLYSVLPDRQLHSCPLTSHNIVTSTLSRSVAVHIIKFNELPETVWE